VNKIFAPLQYQKTTGRTVAKIWYSFHLHTAATSVPQTIPKIVRHADVLWQGFHCLLLKPNSNYVLKI